MSDRCGDPPFIITVRCALLKAPTPDALVSGEGGHLVGVYKFWDAAEFVGAWRAFQDAGAECQYLVKDGVQVEGMIRR